jgi:hypothetical protein
MLPEQLGHPAAYEACSSSSAYGPNFGGMGRRMQSLVDFAMAEGNISVRLPVNFPDLNQ